MNEEPNLTEKSKQTNITIALGFAICVAVIMVLVTTINFLKSSAYTTVKQIQIGSKAASLVDDKTLDVTSPINADDIDEFYKDFQQRIKTLDDSSDFGPNEVSAPTLGL